MTSERDRILQMVADQRLSPEEADRLLSALETKPAPLWRWMFTPLEVIDTRTAVVAACATAGFQLAVSRLHVRFDGALDSHVVPDAVPWKTALADLAVAWPLTALIALSFSWAFVRRGRFIDFLAAVGLARFPLVATSVLIGALRPHFLEASPADPVLVAAALATVPFVAWFIALLATGFRTASGLRGPRFVIAFVLSLAVAEAASTLALIPLER